MYAFIGILFSCGNPVALQDEALTDTTDHTEVTIDTPETSEALPPSATIDTRDVNPTELVEFSKTLIGTPYKYGSIEPQQGFDCSGFITYVFNHFQIAVPRSSVDFTNVGQEIPVHESKPGDLILFTGTDSTRRVVGHMGIIVNNTDSTRFIHSTSGKAYGVTVTPLNGYYMGRFVKTIRIFKNPGQAIVKERKVIVKEPVAIVKEPKPIAKEPKAIVKTPQTVKERRQSPKD